MAFLFMKFEFLLLFHFVWIDSELPSRSYSARTIDMGGCYRRYCRIQDKSGRIFVFE